MALTSVLLAMGCATGVTSDEATFTSGPAAATAGTGGGGSLGSTGTIAGGQTSSTGAAGGAGGTMVAAGGGGTGGSGGGGGAPVAAQACPSGQLATGYDAAGTLQCTALDVAARDALNDACELYFGWRDECNGCTSIPAKWGRVGAQSCANGAGVNNTCTTATLAGRNVRLYGLNTDGDVDGNDKFYAGIRCVPPDPTPAAGPCQAGELMVGGTPGDVACVPAGSAVVSYFQERCSLYFGWRDGCNGCTTAPSKWGRVDGTACQNGVGDDNTCTQPLLAGATVRLFGLNTDGEVDGNDMFHLGLHCLAGSPATATEADLCPEGQFVTGIAEGGALLCQSPAPLAEGIVRDGCHLYLGWRDQCDGCTSPPTKWGRVSGAACQSGAGLDNVCIVGNLGGQSVRLLGLNTDGDMNDDDKLYVGMGCF